jgi:hypothetical protein
MWPVGRRGGGVGFATVMLNVVLGAMQSAVMNNKARVRAFMVNLLLMSASFVAV